MRLKVYRNLHKKLFSVVDLRTGRVRYHCNYLVLRGVEFRVQQSGREKVLETRQKNVHAYVVGELTRETPVCEVEVTYDPYRYESFVIRETGEPIYQAQYCLFRSGRCWVQL